MFATDEEVEDPEEGLATLAAELETLELSTPTEPADPSVPGGGASSSSSSSAAAPAEAESMTEADAELEKNYSNINTFNLFSELW